MSNVDSAGFFVYNGNYNAEERGCGDGTSLGHLAKKT